MEQISAYSDKLADWVIYFGPKLLMAFAVLWIGFKIIHKIVHLTDEALKRAKLGEDIRPFLISMLTILLKIVILFIAATIIGFKSTGLVALLAAAGFGVGMALQGALGNFAAGIIILIFKPYKIGDWVEIQDKFGRVDTIQIFHTSIITPGKKQLIIPNGIVIGGTITNFSSVGMIRMELEVSIPYSADFPEIKRIILEEVLVKNPLILRDPSPEIGILEFDSHSIKLTVRPYVRPDDFWEVFFTTNEGIKAAFHRHDVKVAYSEGVEYGEIGK